MGAHLLAALLTAKEGRTPSRNPQPLWLSVTPAGLSTGCPRLRQKKTEKQAEGERLKEKVATKRKTGII